MKLTVLNSDIADVPENKWHWPPWLSDLLLCIVPCIPITQDSSTSISINTDSVTCDDEASVMVLKDYRIGAVAPIAEII